MASKPVVEYAPPPFYCMTLEIENDQALRGSKGNFDVYMYLSEEAMGCLNWWKGL